MSIYDERIAKRKAEKSGGQSSTKTSSAASATSSIYDERIAKRKAGHNTAQSYGWDSQINDLKKWSENLNALYKGAEVFYKAWRPSDSFETYDAYYAGRADELRKQAEEYRALFWDNADIVKYIGDALKGLDESLGINSRNKDYWAQWDSKQEYDDYKEKGEYDLEAGQKEIDELEAQLADMERTKRNATMWQQVEQKKPTTVTRQDIGYNPHAMWQQGAVEAPGITEEEKLRQLIAQKKQYLNQAKRIQESNAYADTVNNADFDKFDDYVESEDTLYNWINDAQFRDSYEARFQRNGTKSKYGYNNYDRMDKSEVAIYNYYYAKSGKEAAQKYLDSIQEQLNARTAGDIYGAIEDHTALEMVFGVAAGLEGFGTSIANNFNFKDDYIAQSAVQIASGMVREDLADKGAKLPEAFGGSSLWQVAYDAVTTGANMAPSILVSVATGVPLAGSTLMGLSASGNAYQQALNEGFDKTQARGYSILVGASEMAMENILGGISALGGNRLGKNAVMNIANADKMLKVIAKKITASMLSEAGEEYLQEVLDPVFRNLMLHTGEDVMIVTPEAIYSAMLGALTAFFMEGPSVVAGEVKTYRTGKELQKAGLDKRLAQIGNTFAADTVAYQLAGKVDSNTGAYTLGRLFNEIGATLTEQNVSEITEALIARNMDEATAKKNAQALARVIEGEELTDQQIAMIEANDVLADAAKTALIDSNTTWNQRSQGYHDVLRKLAEDKVKREQAGASKASVPTDNTAAAGKENAPSAAQNAEGRDINTTTQEAVATDKIKSITKDGVVFVQEDGSEVSSKDVSYADAEDGLVYEAFTEMRGLSTDAANEIVSIRRKTSGNGQLFANVMQIAYEYGYANLSETALIAKTYRGNIPIDSVQRIYQIGKEARAAEDAKRAQTQKSVTDGKTGVYRLTETGEVKQLGEGKEALKVLTVNERRSVGVQTAQFLQKIGVGGNYFFIQSYSENGKRLFVDRNGKVQEAHNGMYYSNGDIYIDLNAGTSSGITLFTISHELAHFVQQWDSAKYKVLADFLAKHYAKNGISAYRAIKIKQQELTDSRGYAVSFQEAYHEFVADSLSTMFSDGDIYEKLLDLKKTDKLTFNKIRSYINKLAQKAKLYYGGEIANTTEGMFMQMQSKETIDQLQQMFADALVGASENYRNAETQKNTDQEVGVQYSHEQNSSMRDVYAVYEKPITEKDIEVLRSIGRKSVNKFTSGDLEKSQKWAHRFFKEIGTKSPFFRAWFGDWRMYDTSDVVISDIPQYIGTNESRKMNRGVINNIDTKWNIRISREGETNTISHSGADRLSEYGLAGIQNLVKNAVLLNTEVHEHHKNNPINDLITFDHKLYALGRNTDGEIGLYRITVEEYYQSKKEPANKKFHNLKHIEKIADITGGRTFGKNRSGGSTDGNSAITYTVSDVVYFVKKYDDEYSSPPAVSEAVHNENGTPKVMYHGTSNGGHTVFDTWGKSKYGLFGTGSYFTDSKSIAESYTNKGKGNNKQVYEVYLNIKKPLDMDVKADPSLWAKAFGDVDFPKSGTNEDFYRAVEEYYADQYIPKWEVAEIIRDAIEFGMGYDGITHIGGGRVDPNGDKHRVYIVFNPEQIKSATDNIGIFDSNNPDIRYSDASSEPVSNRTLLANAMESLAKHEVEKKYLSEYKAKIETMNAEEQKLREIRAQIKELSCTKGPRDTKKLKDLKFEAIRINNRINIYDKQLLRLEASQALKNILEREKAKAYQRGRAKGEAALERSRENRNKTAMRHKIQNVVKELNSLLLSNDKKRHVPDNLKKAVAEALDLVNMDTVGAEERAAKYADLIAKEQAKANPDQDVIDSYISTMEDILLKGEKMGERLNKLHAAYEEIQNSDDPDIANGYDPVIAGAIKELSATIGNTSIKNMSIEQLSDVYDVYRAILTRVRDANKAMAENIKESIEELAKSTIREVQSVGGSKKYRISFLDAVRKFDWDNLKPVYAMDRIGSSTLTEVFNNVRAGEDVWARDVSEARAYYLEKSKKYGYDKWDFEKKYRFESNSGIPFELTLEQMMSLYAYSKREQAADHLRLGGFVFDSNIETTKEKNGKKSILKYKVNTADAHQITPEIMTDIIGNLTKEQALFVDEMQDYLSTVMGAKGNEVTSKMYGIKLFKEKFYFPLKSAKQFMFEQNEVSGEVRIKNSGFTNKVVTNANNPVILSNFMDVWSGHVNDMSMYHAFTLPLEDFNRVFNFNSPKRDGVESVSVKGTIQNAYGPAAVEYLRQMITDLNGGARTDSRADFPNKMMGRFKKGAVFASLSVVVQQPSAIARAAALIDTKYFIGPRVDQKRHKYLWDEVKKYAPVAIIKEMGYFDTNMGKSTKDFITGKEYTGFGEKMKAVVTDSNYRDEILSKAPALADEIAWCGIWAAVKRETKAKYPGMDTQSEAFLKLAGQRFTEVITKTQVYDSVLARSANMRSKDGIMKMATAFMAEPTTSANMIADAILKGKRGNKRYVWRTVGAVVSSAILNSILVSFVYAARDDDEDETYLEKYLGSLAGGVIDGINPATYIPFIKDVFAIAQGYDVERSDMAVVSDFINACKQLKSDKISTYQKVENFAGSIAQIFGLPVKNIMRDVRGIYNAIMTITGAEKTTGAGVKYAIGESITGKTVSSKEQLYEARMAGDTAHVARVEARYDDMDSADAAVREAIRDRFMEDNLDEATALEHMVKYAGMDGSEAHWTMDAWKYRKAVGSDEGYGKYGRFYDAVRSGEKLAEVIKEYTDNGVKTSMLTENISKEFKPVYVDASASERTVMKTKLIDAYVACGMDRDDAEGKLESWDFEAEYGFAYSDRKEAYLDGKVSRENLIDILIDRGYDEDDADVQVDVYEWQEEGLDDISIKAVQTYRTWAEPAGIPKAVYYSYWKFDNATENDRDPITGKVISGTAVKKIMAYINSLNLTDAQKDALAKCAGWKDSTIKKNKLW